MKVTALVSVMLALVVADVRAAERELTLEFGAYYHELTAGNDQRYLEHADGGWSLSTTIAIGDVGGDVRQHILDHEDPPEQIVYGGRIYRLDAAYAGHMHPGGDGAGRHVIRWEFLDEAETGFVGIEQWSETEFTAAAGSIVEDYQFTHILPGGTA